ncbi:MAG: DUF4124 domain-containing protein [Pseudomonadota bacterium]|nr:DUF4124 domain-containing protein [Pseudomonadota bacterium]
MRVFVLAGIFFCALWLPGATGAMQVYKCTAANGAVGYQDKPCPAPQKQKTVQLSDAPIVASAPTASAPPSATSIAPAPVYTPPPPLPTMYACTRYDGERHYLSDTLPQPYYVPLGALGYPGQSLDRAYGGRDRLGMSAPEEARPPKLGGPLIANALVEVQDDCQPAQRTQVCGELRRRYDANHEKLRMAFPSDQPPLEQRERDLRVQLSGC